MPWTRLGLVYAPDGAKPWARSHAALPTPVQIGLDLYRFFISCRDADNRSHVSWVDVDLADHPRVVGEASEPALAPGAPGSFDQDGIGVGSLVSANGELWLYYMGWKLASDVPWKNTIGLAHAQAPFSRFERWSPSPILDCSVEDPYSLSYPWVTRIRHDDWRMFYGSNLSLAKSSSDMQHVIKAARSVDGIHWQRDGATVVGFATAQEYALARPTIVEVGSVFLMCFAGRGERYRILAAVSTDGHQWKRVDEIGLAPTAAGWDSEMTCYPALFWHRDRLWLAYNGNGYGATGFGLAVWEGPLPLLRTD